MINTKLTNTERLILANQFEILGILKKDSSYQLLSEALRDGHSFIYDDLHSYSMNLSPELSEDKTNLVLETLMIYSDLGKSYDKLTEEEKLNVNNPSQINFQGFDGNDEIELVNFVDALLKNRRFDVVLQRDGSSLNSHREMTYEYKKLIHKWKLLGKPRYPFSLETINSLIN